MHYRETKIARSLKKIVFRVSIELLANPLQDASFNPSFGWLFVTDFAFDTFYMLPLLYDRVDVNHTAVQINWNGPCFFKTKKSAILQIKLIWTYHKLPKKSCPLSLKMCGENIEATVSSNYTISSSVASCDSESILRRVDCQKLRQRSTIYYLNSKPYLGLDYVLFYSLVDNSGLGNIILALTIVHRASDMKSSGNIGTVHTKI